MTFWKKNKTPTNVDARASTKDPQISMATIVTVDPTKVDACVSTEHQPTCDGSTRTMEHITIMVDADVSTEDQKEKKNRINRKRTNKTQPKVDACVSTEHPRTCDAITTMDSTVMCAAYTQTETRMDFGAAAAKRELKIKTQKRRSWRYQGDW